MRLSSLVSRAASLAVFTLGGCTMVLGIHHAELDDAGAAGSPAASTGTGAPSTTSGACGQVAPDCSSCLKSRCGTDIADCLGDSECRRSLETYTACLGLDCIDDSFCAENKISNLNLAQCITKQCATQCALGAAVSRCELYCACMQSACAMQFTDGFGGTLQSCEAKCMAWNVPRDVKCRWTHCEFATPSPADAEFHCPHASGTPPSKDVCISVMPSSRHVCTSGQETGFPCHGGDECCSGTCNANVCQ